MANSSLVTYTKLSPNRNSPRKNTIDTVTVHCVCGQLSVETLGDIFAKPSRGASSNYGIGFDGRIALYVPESDRSWCSGGTDAAGNPIRVNGISGADNDQRAITIEVASDKEKPYRMNDIALERLVDLLVDIVRRNPSLGGSLRWKNDKTLVGNTAAQNVTLHRWYANTSCPGEFFVERLPDIVAAVNKKLTAEPSPKYVAGDIVYFLGGFDHNSSTDKSTGNKKAASLARVSKVAAGALHPYHVRRIDEKGKYIGGGVYGWVDLDTLTT
jgi:hypothetical protein